MLASLTELKTYRVRGADGDLGRIDDLAFRQNEWIVRYAVVEMEELAREALLLSAYLGTLDRGAHTLSADVRREQVANTDPLDRSQPLSDRDERRLHDQYGWPAAWWQEEQDIGPIGGLWSEEPRAPANADEPEIEGPMLLYVSDLIEAYAVEGEGGEIGRLLDVIVELEQSLREYYDRYTR